jgi:1-deoxy-D-xylulose-5-phosphate synthase
VGVIVTLEDHVLMGGFGSVVLETLSDLGLEVPVVRVGWPDQFIEHGKVDQLRARYGISVEGAMEKLAPFLQRRNPKRLVALPGK